MPTKGKSNLYGRGKRGKSDDNIAFPYATLFLSKGFDSHYEKHGLNEMGLTRDQYRSRAIAFANKVDPLNHVSFINSKHFTYKYSLSTGEVVMVSEEGAVATYFKTNINNWERIKINNENR